MHEIRRWRCTAFAIILAAIAASNAGAAEDRNYPVERLAAAARASIAPQCGGHADDPSGAASALDASTPQARGERLLAQEKRKACDCMSQSIDAYVAARGGSTLVAPADAALAMEPPMNACTARMLRAAMQDICASGLDPFAKPGSAPIAPERQRAHCACMQAGVARMTDQQIVDASSASHRDVEARTKARTEGAPEPAASPNAMHDLEHTCRADEAAR